MRKYLGFVAVSVLLLSCAEPEPAERNNPYDALAYNYIGNASAEGSSSNAVSSSSPTGGLCAGFVEGTKRLHDGKEKEQFCDERDGKKYVYVQIDTQTWMAENLNYAATGSKCGDGSSLSNNNTTTCDTYGRLYNWNTATIVCSSGWHLPSDAEWSTLETTVGGSSRAGTKLKAASGWSNNGNGTNEDGFSALPGGEGNNFNGSFISVGDEGCWWSADGVIGVAVFRGMDYSRSYVYIGNIITNSVLFSVRCVRD
jgi:uncharacterized protein (TIGR02145 family)